MYVFSEQSTVGVEKTLYNALSDGCVLQRKQRDLQRGM